MALTQVSDNGLTNTGVTAATYGSSSAIPSLTIDAKGRVTSATTSAIDSTSIANGTSNVSVAANGEVTVTRAGSQKLTTKSDGVDVTGEVQCDSLDVDGNVDVAGTIRTNRLVVDDDGSNSPLLAIRGDDGNPWGFNIGNDTYSTSESIGYKIYQGNDGSIRTQARGDGAYVNWYLDSYNGTSNHNVIHVDTNRAVHLAHAGSTKLSTKSDGVDVTGEVQCDSLDNDGASSFAGVATFNANYTSFNNNGYIRGDSSGVFQLQAGNSNTFRFTNSANSTTFAELTSGSFSPGANNSYDLGTTSLRWRNVYTNDLNLSNEGSVNDVDGTWGSYTIQEGEDDLFLINRRNGKKYKFNLTEVN